MTQTEAATLSFLEHNQWLYLRRWIPRHSTTTPVLDTLAGINRIRIRPLNPECNIILAEPHHVREQRLRAMRPLVHT